MTVYRETDIQKNIHQTPRRNTAYKLKMNGTKRDKKCREL